MWPSAANKQPVRQNYDSGRDVKGKVQELEDQIVELKKAHAKDKNFYEEALETRMNQIEELEEQVEQLN